MAGGDQAVEIVTLHPEGRGLETPDTGGQLFHLSAVLVKTSFLKMIYIVNSLIETHRVAK